MLFEVETLGWVYICWLNCCCCCCCQSRGGVGAERCCACCAELALGMLLEVGTLGCSIEAPAGICEQPVIYDIVKHGMTADENYVSMHDIEARL